MFIASRFIGDLLNGPGQCGPQGLSQHGSTGFADGRQPTERPILRMALLELAREQTVRQHHQVWPVRKKMSHSLFEKISDAASKKDASHECGPLRH